MNSTHNPVGLADLLELLSGDKERAIEGAKELIRVDEPGMANILARILSDRAYRYWSRVFAAYGLGFSSKADSLVLGALREALVSANEGVTLRAHAAEALGNQKAAAAVEDLVHIMFNEGESKQLRKWCIYALSEIADQRSLEALREFRGTNPTRYLLEELHVCLDD